MENEIVSRKVETRKYGNVLGFPIRYEPGETLTMSDGSRWFHPYCGAKPERLKVDSFIDDHFEIIHVR